MNIIVIKWCCWIIIGGLMVADVFVLVFQAMEGGGIMKVWVYWYCYRYIVGFV